MSLYPIAKDLIESAEDLLLGADHLPFQMLSRLRKEFWHPLVYVATGMDYLFQNFMKTLFYMLLFTGLAAFLSTRLGLSPQQVNANITIAIVGALFVILFSLPSTFTHFGIKDGHIAILAQRIQDQVECKSQLEGLRSNFEAMEESAADRVRTLRWTLATLWGGLLFAYGQSMGFLTKLAEKNQIGDLIGGSIVFFATAAFITLLPLAAITGYRRANNIVFRGLQFACNQAAVIVEHTRE